MGGCYPKHHELFKLLGFKEPVYDIDGVSLSMPAIVGADGIESDIPINLSGEEALKLKESADSLKKIMETIEL